MAERLSLRRVRVRPVAPPPSMEESCRRADPQSAMSGDSVFHVRPSNSVVRFARHWRSVPGPLRRSRTCRPERTEGHDWRTWLYQSALALSRTPRAWRILHRSDTLGSRTASAVPTARRPCPCRATRLLNLDRPTESSAASRSRQPSSEHLRRSGQLLTPESESQPMPSSLAKEARRTLEFSSRTSLDRLAVPFCRNDISQCSRWINYGNANTCNASLSGELRLVMPGWPMEVTTATYCLPFLPR